MAPIPDEPGKPVGQRAWTICKMAQSMLGRPYIWGAGGPNNFDCSGLVWFCYSYAGVNVAGNGTTGNGGFDFGEMTKHRWTTATIQFLGQEVPYGQELSGDLIMPTAGHVGICIGNGGYINAPTAGGHVQISKYNKPYKIRRLVVPTQTPYWDGTSKLAGLAPDPQGRQPWSLASGQAIQVTPGDVVESAVGTIGDVISALSDIGKVLEWLSKGENWIRIGEVIGGAAMVFVAAKSMVDRVRA